jgi:hypothetical protein
MNIIHDIPTIPYLLLFLLVFYGGCILLQNLGAGTVPRALEPLSSSWVKSGRNPKWVNFALWALFCADALVIMVPIGYVIYEAAMGLGRPGGY